MEPSPIPEPEREAIVRHRHERNLQILLPVLIVVTLVILVGALVIAAYYSQNPDLIKWANTAMIYLLGITMALMVLLFIVVLALNVALGFGLIKTPTYTGEFSEQFLHYSALSRQYMDKVADPIITFKTWIGVPSDVLRKGNRKGK